MAVNSWEIPKVGKMDPRVVVGVLAAAAGFVGWQWYRKRGDAGTTTDATATDPSATSDFADGGTVPGVLGAVSPTNSYGLPADSTGTPVASTSDYGFHGTTNDQWTQYAAAQLSQADQWSYGDIVAALGNYLSGAPLTTLQKSIVQAAKAVAGDPPVGGPRPIISGGDTAITVAPIITAATVTEDSVTLTFSPVPGAASYRAYRTGVASNVGSSSGNTVTIGGLHPNTTYRVGVRPVTASGTEGPSSVVKTIKTKALVLATPAAPGVTAVTASSAHLTVAPVKGAESYYWYVNGALHGHSDAPAYTLTGLHSKTTYKVSVAADTSPGAPSHVSAARSFKTR